ncbi:MAG: hypothetical protein LUD72_04440, partial [Bacteroidales bacterium]|nr:hypothetical protein [Bacteroidales bacterium]
MVSLAEVAWVLAKDSKVEDRILDNGLAGINEDNMDLLMRVFGYTATNEQDNVEAEYEIDHTTIVGVANNHGTNASDIVNYRRNQLLSKNRGDTVKLWLESLRSDLNISVEQNLINEAVSEDVSDEKPKIERRAEVRIF